MPAFAREQTLPLANLFLVALPYVPGLSPHRVDLALGVDESGFRGKLEIDLARVRTNLVYFSVAADHEPGHDELIRRLRDEHGILLGPDRPRLRAVTHYWIGRPEIESFVGAVREIVTGAAAR